MTIKLAGILIDPPVLLAPLAGITDLPFRRLVHSFGAGLVVSEMIASHDIINAQPKARARAELGFGAANTAVQIAGNDADLMARCALICQDNGARIIDINMGCPSKMVTNGAAGSALMKDPDHALRLIEAVVRAVDVPVTLKTRLGWNDDNLNVISLAKRAETAGIQMLTVHGRTRCQFYKGRADWDQIAGVVAALRIPVVANGDIVSVGSARSALRRSRADGVMVGRGARGKPWLLADIAASVVDGQPRLHQPDDMAALVTRHYQDMLSFYGVQTGLRVARKHLGWYMDALLVPKALRREILTSQTPEFVLGALAHIFAHPPARVAA